MKELKLHLSSPIHSLLGHVNIGKYITLTPYFEVKTREVIRSVSLKIYQVIFLVVLTVISGYLLQEFVYITKKWSTYETFMFILVNAVIYTMIIMAMVRLLFSNPEWENLLKNLLTSEEKLEEFDCITKDVIKYYYLKYAANYIPLIIVMFFDSYYYLFDDKTDVEPVYFVITQYIPCVILNFFVLLMIEVCSTIKNQLEKIKKILQEEIIRNINSDLSFSVLNGKKWFKAVKMPEEQMYVVRKLTGIYLTLYKCTGLFSLLFGWEIVLLNIIAVSGVLPALEYTIKYMGSSDVNDALYYAHCSWAVWQMFLAIQLIICGHNTSALEGEIRSLTFTALRQIETRKEYEMVKADLELLAEATVVCKIEFSAAGVFPVDYTLLYILFTSVTSYLIVLIQLM